MVSVLFLLMFVFLVVSVIFNILYSDHLDKTLQDGKVIYKSTSEVLDENGRFKTKYFLHCFVEGKRTVVLNVNKQLYYKFQLDDVVPVPPQFF